MKNNFSEAKATGGTGARLTRNKQLPGKMVVAYVNKQMDKNVQDDPENNSSTRRRASVFSTTGGNYYINGIPILPSRQNDSALYEEELSEYY
jgi:hypothetical protein